MPIVKYGKDGYGQIELNQVAWRRDGRIEAQCHLEPTTGFPDGEVAENGMLLAVDKAKRLLYKGTQNAAGSYPIGINYSTEHLYDERQAGGLKYFALKAKDDFLPRIGYPAVGDTFTTNTICYDTTFAADDEEFEEEVADAMTNSSVYAILGTNAFGYWEVTSTLPAAGLAARVVEVTTMPDGQFALKLHILRV